MYNHPSLEKAIRSEELLTYPRTSQEKVRFQRVKVVQSLSCASHPALSSSHAQDLRSRRLDVKCYLKYKIRRSRKILPDGLPGFASSFGLHVQDLKYVGFEEQRQQPFDLELRDEYVWGSIVTVNFVGMQTIIIQFMY